MLKKRQKMLTMVKMAMNNKYIRERGRGALLALMFAAVLCCVPRIEAKMTYRLNDTVRTGFNALGHVLQRPLGNPTFENKRFGDHLFLSGGAGVSMAGIHADPGAHLELSVGDWATPVHGWRVNFGIGNHSIKKGWPGLSFGAVSADYMLNFTSLLRGYRQQRAFEFIGAIGAEYQRVKSDGVWGNEFGLRASLQARFNVSRSLFLYLEPRLTLLAGTRYKGMVDDYRRFRPDLGFNVGLGYRLLQGDERASGSVDFINIEDNHMFFGVGGGAVSFLRGADRSTIGAGAQIYIGKWLSSVAGLRAKWQFGRYGLQGDPGHRYIAIGALDYVWNISSAFGGYRPDEVFGLNLNLGVAAAYADDAKARLYPGIEGGLTASFRLSPNWSFYIEPQVQVFTRRFSRDAGNGFGISPMGSVMAGLHYTIGNFAHDFPESYEEYAKSRNYFLTVSGAPAWRLRGDYGNGFAASAGFGKRFTPVSSWRLTADGEIFNRAPRFIALSLSADYLFSISTSMAGFNPYRVFDVSGVFGVTGGIAHYGSGTVKPLIGAKAGLHGSFRLSDALDLYIEPVFMATKAPSLGGTGWTPEVRVMAGLSYKLGREASFSDHSVYESPLEGLSNFVSLSGGPTFFSGNFHNRRVNGAFDLSVGRWFTLVSGLRAGITYDFVPNENKWRRLNMGSVHADYLLNMTSLVTRDAMRRFHIIGVLGGGVSFSDAAHSRAGLMLETGMQFRYNLPFNVDVHLEPDVSFVMNRVMPNYRHSSRFSVITRVMAGASYRF